VSHALKSLLSLPKPSPSHCLSVQFTGRNKNKMKFRRVHPWKVLEMCSFIFGNPLGRTSMSPLFQGANHREGIRWSLGVWHRKIFVIELEKEPRKRAPDNWRVYPFNAFGQSDVILKIQHTHPFRNPFLFPLYLFISRLLHHHHHHGVLPSSNIEYGLSN